MTRIASRRQAKVIGLVGCAQSKPGGPTSARRVGPTRADNPKFNLIRNKTRESAPTTTSAEWMQPLR